MGMFDFMSGSSSANNYLKKIPGVVKPYYDPYIESGNQAIPILEEQYGKLVSNPGDIYSSLGSGFQTSPGYNFALEQALNASNNAAAAGGMAGSPMHEQQNMTVATGLADQDYYNYMNDVLGLYNTGLSGEQKLYNTGYQASDTLAKILSGNLQSQATAAAMGNQYGSAMGLGLLGIGAGLLPYTNLLPYHK